MVPLINHWCRWLQHLPALRLPPLRRSAIAKQPVVSWWRLDLKETLCCLIFLDKWRGLREPLFERHIFGIVRLVCVCVNAAWIVCGKLLLWSTTFFRKIRLFVICLFLGVFALCVFESWLNELTDRDLRAWQQMASCIFSPLPRQSTWKNRRTRSREKWDQRWTALECKRWSMSQHHVISWSF